MDLVDVSSDEDESFVDRIKQKEETYKNLLGDGWVADRTIYDYLALKLLDVLVLEPFVFHPAYDIEVKGLVGSRPDLGCGLVIMPIHLEDHWLLCTLDSGTGIAILFDTLRKQTEEIADRIEKISKMLIEILPAAEEGTQKPEEVYLVQAHDESYNLQFDTNSCGPLVCMIAKAFYNNESLLFSSGAITNWRRDAYFYLTVNNSPVPCHPIRR